MIRDMAFGLMAGVFVLGASVGCSHTSAQTAGCTGDLACRAQGGVCVNGTCQQCRTDSDCGSGMSCMNNRCMAAVAQSMPAQQPGVTVASTDGSRDCFQAVYFDFNDAELSQSTRTALQQTAACLRRQPEGHYVLVGRADPRGTTEYNLALGARRAHSVEHYLVMLGIDAHRLSESSQGAEYATGTDESTWAHDRRVDDSRGARNP